MSQNTDPAELERSALLVAEVSPDISVFLQPVTPLAVSEQFCPIPMLAPAADQVLNWQALMKGFVKHVRVIPQTHKMLNQL